MAYSRIKCIVPTKRNVWIKVLLDISWAGSRKGISLIDTLFIQRQRIWAYGQLLKEGACLEHQLQLSRHIIGSWTCAVPSTEWGGATTSISIWKKPEMPFIKQYIVRRHTTTFLVASQQQFQSEVNWLLFIINSNHLSNSFKFLVLEKVKRDT